MWCQCTRLNRYMSAGRSVGQWEALDRADAQRLRDTPHDRRRWDCLALVLVAVIAAVSVPAFLQATSAFERANSLLELYPPGVACVVFPDTGAGALSGAGRLSVASNKTYGPRDMVVAWRAVVRSTVANGTDVAFYLEPLEAVGTHVGREATYTWPDDAAGPPALSKRAVHLGVLPMSEYTTPNVWVRGAGVGTMRDDTYELYTAETAAWTYAVAAYARDNGRTLAWGLLGTCAPNPSVLSPPALADAAQGAREENQEWEDAS